jgi:SAM-dependent methyltransferase
MTSTGSEHIEDLRKRFSAIYEQNEWGAQSGVGSLPINTLEYSVFVQQFIHRNDIRTVVDFGCGSWQFSRFIDWSNVNYLGIDVVPALIERHKQVFARENIDFLTFETIDVVPTADLLLCKDVLQHLPNQTVQEYLQHFRHKFKFMLITNDDAPPGYSNQDIEAGGWRTLRLDHEPFREHAAIVLQWVVVSGHGWTRKATYLIYGNRGRSESA